VYTQDFAMAVQTSAIFSSPSRDLSLPLSSTPSFTAFQYFLIGVPPINLSRGLGSAVGSQGGSGWSPVTKRNHIDLTNTKEGDMLYNEANNKREISEKRRSFIPVNET